MKFKKTDHFEWHDFFCLWPRTIGDQYVWLETVERKLVLYNSCLLLVKNYRLKEKQESEDRINDYAECLKNVPEEIARDYELSNIYYDALADADARYQQLTACGVDPEIAKSVLPRGRIDE